MPDPIQGQQLDEVAMLRLELERQLREREQEKHYLDYIADKRRRQNRYYAVTVLTAAIGVAVLAFLLVPGGLEQSSAFRSASLTFLVVSLIAAAFIYLQPASPGRAGGDSEDLYSRLRFYVDERLSKSTAAQSSSAPPIDFTDADKAKIVSSIQAKLESDALQTYAAGLRDLIAASIRSESVDQRFDATTGRLGREINDQSRRGNLNLIIGAVTAIVGVSILGYSVFYFPPPQSSRELLIHFVPRVSLAVLVEIFAYFFLRLYKQSLVEIKYFQNEVTNVELKALAVHATQSSNDPTLRKQVIAELAKTERNLTPVRDQGESPSRGERMSEGAFADAIGALREAMKLKAEK